MKADPSSQSFTEGQPIAAGFDPQLLREALRPLDFNAPARVGVEEQRYLAHYGIDFSKEFPGLEHRMGYFAAADHRLFAQIFRPNKAVGTAFVLHGYLDHSGIYGHLIRYLLKRDLAVVIFDQPGHGMSYGEPASIDSFGRYVAAYQICQQIVAPHVPKPWHLIAQSMGGAVAMEHLLQRRYRKEQSPYRNIVLLAPLYRPYGWKTLRVVYTLLHRFKSTWPRTWRGNSHDEAFCEFLRDRDPLQARTLSVRWITAMVKWMHAFEKHTPTDLPLTIIQGGDDHTVDAAFNLKIIAGKFAVEMIDLPEAKHHLVNESPEIRQHLFDAINARWVS